MINLRRRGGGRMRLAAGAGALALAFASSPAVAQAAQAAQVAQVAPGWPQLQGGAAHNGDEASEKSLTAGNVGQLALAWKDTLPGESVDSQVVVTGGTAYLAAGNDVIAYDAATGAQLWQAALPGDAVGTPAVQGDLVVVAANKTYVHGHHVRYTGYVVALDSATGSLAWTHILPASPAGAVTASRTHVYVPVGFPGNGSLNVVVALKLDTGARLWTSATLPAAGCSLSTPSVSGGLVVVGSGGEYETALHATTGTVAWQDTIASDGCEIGPFDWVPAISGGVVYTGSATGVDALDLATGAVIWQNNSVGLVDEPVSVTRDAVIASLRQGHGLTALSRAGGSVLWTHPTPHYVSMVATFGNLAWAFSAKDEGFRPAAFTVGTGRRVYIGTYFQDGSQGLPPVVAAGHVYVNTDDFLECLALPATLSPAATGR